MTGKTAIRRLKSILADIWWYHQLTGKSGAALDQEAIKLAIKALEGKEGND